MSRAFCASPQRQQFEIFSGNAHWRLIFFFAKHDKNYLPLVSFVTKKTTFTPFQIKYSRDEEICSNYGCCGYNSRFVCLRIVERQLPGILAKRTTNRANRAALNKKHRSDVFYLRFCADILKDVKPHLIRFESGFVVYG